MICGGFGIKLYMVVYDGFDMYVNQGNNYLQLMN